MMPLVLLAAATGSVGLFVAKTDGVGAEDRSFLISAFAEALQRETGQSAVIDDFATTPAELRVHHGVRSVLTVTMVTGSRLARLTVVHDREGDDEKALNLDLPRDRASWAPTLDGVVRVLFPLDLAPRPSPSTDITAPPAPPASTTIGWAGVGVGAAAIVAGVILEIVARRDLSDAADLAAEYAVSGGSMTKDEALALDDRGRALQLGGNVAILVGAIVSTAGAVYLGMAE